METKANYVLIGAFTIAVTVCLLLFALWAAKFASDRSWHRYQVIFNEPVTGLSEGSAVQYNGISVGTVERLRLDPSDPRRVQALLKLQAEAPVKVDTKAKISQQGLTGSPFIQLTGGTPSSPLLLPHGDEVPAIYADPSALQNMADTANKLLSRVDEILSDANIKRINGTLENLKQTTDAINGQREDIKALLVNVRKASEDLRTTLATANATMKTANGAVAHIDQGVVRRLPATIDKLDKAIASFQGAGENANLLITENRTPINNFTRDGLQQIGPTLEELRVLMRDIKHVANGLDRNPAGYLLGRDQTPKEFTPK